MIKTAPLLLLMISPIVTSLTFLISDPPKRQDETLINNNKARVEVIIDL